MRPKRKRMHNYIGKCGANNLKLSEKFVPEFNPICINLDENAFIRNSLEKIFLRKYIKEICM